MISLIEKNKNKLVELCKKFQVKSMYVFGSATNKNFDFQSSDIDILIDFMEIPFDVYTDNYFLLKDSLEKLFNRKVDLITERSLNNPYFIQDIEETKRLLYAA